MTYVNVTIRWKDSSFDAIPEISHARDIRPLVSPSPTPVSAVSKLDPLLETPDRWVTAFLRRFPAAFVESVGQHNIPWFRLSDAATQLLQEERSVFAARRADVCVSLRRVVLMTSQHHLPLRIPQALASWHSGELLKGPGS
jgi:hypothetical protein